MSGFRPHATTIPKSGWRELACPCLPKCVPVLSNPQSPRCPAFGVQDARIISQSSGSGLACPSSRPGHSSLTDRCDPIPGKRALRLATRLAQALVQPGRRDSDPGALQAAFSHFTALLDSTLLRQLCSNPRPSSSICCRHPRHHPDEHPMWVFGFRPEHGLPDTNSGSILMPSTGSQAQAIPSSP